jgi:hypothetical protein
VPPDELSRTQHELVLAITYPSPQRQQLAVHVDQLPQLLVIQRVELLVRASEPFTQVGQTSRVLLEGSPNKPLQLPTRPRS